MSGGLERISMDKNQKHPLVVIREHLLRYVLVLQDIPNKDVLDIACGTGYGMYLMSYWAKSISGYDNDEATVKAAKRDFQMKAPAFFDVRDLETSTDLSNAITKMFDVITCFETLEHLSNPELLLQNIKKHLKPGGVFYFSTPNKKDLIDKSKWHKSVFNKDKWIDLLEKHFGDITQHGELWGQDRLGFSKDFNKPYIVGRIEICQ